jgi:Tfp pilus assembly protein PilO
MGEKDVYKTLLPKDPDKTLVPAGFKRPESEILVNDYGQTKDATVVVEEADRTVLVTPNETIVFEKEPIIDIAPKNRPRKVYGGMWGPAEIATIGMAFLAILTVILVYIFLVVPSQRELEKNRAERDRLEREMISAKAKYGDITSTETQVAKLIASVDDFESRFLPQAANGRNALYQRINGLIVGYGLVNTTGPDFAPLEVADKNQQNQSDEERGRAKFRSLFPGVYVTTTVEGSYQNLRRFIREIETGNEFVVISAVELEPSDSEQKSAPVMQPVTAGLAGNPYAANIQPAVQNPMLSKDRGKTHGAVVRLRLEMAAYFRRPMSEPPAAEPQ